MIIMMMQVVVVVVRSLLLAMVSSPWVASCDWSSRWLYDVAAGWKRRYFDDGVRREYRRADKMYQWQQWDDDDWS